MEVAFSPEQETLLAEAAVHAGRTTPEYVRDLALSRLDEDRRFARAVDLGLEYADRGEFVDDDEMEARFQRMMSVA